MDCAKCGASLPPKSDTCKYCGKLNERDLRMVHWNTKNEARSTRICPRCEERLLTVDLSIDGKFLIERCESCFGTFFDAGELEAFVKASVEHVYDIDMGRINVLLEERGSKEWPMGYIKCPVCRSIMNRKAYGARSGVIVDCCREHGVWVDGGELGVILRWTKAGGQKHHEAKDVEKARLRESVKNFLPDTEQEPDLGERKQLSDKSLFVDLVTFLYKNS